MRSPKKMRSPKILQEKIMQSSRDIAYSQFGRLVARKILSSNANNPVRSKVVDLGYEDKLRQIATDSLPEGYFYAKLVIKNWRDHLGKSFKLYENENLVFGTVIEAPADNRSLEYRNIIVSSKTERNFTLDIDAKFNISIGPGGFFTPEQEAYDKKFGVEKHGYLYFATRGNRLNPKRVIFSFPEFGKANSKISFPVETFKSISDQELSETLLVCFQDRYSVSGTYMLANSAGQDLTPTVRREIERIRVRYNVSESEILFAGASKGASIALTYAEPYKNSRLLIAAPQLHLGYYLKSASYRDNLGRNSAVINGKRHWQLLNQYRLENREIDYFYSLNDEESNYSFIEQLKVDNKLRSYRINGINDVVSKKARPSILNIIRRFIKDEPTYTIDCEQIRIYPRQDGIALQVRLDSSSSVTSQTNWYIGQKNSKSFKGNLLTQGTLPFLKYTSDDQIIHTAFEDLTGMNRIVGISEDGTRYESSIDLNDPETISKEVSNSLVSPEASVVCLPMLAVTNVQVVAGYRCETYGLRSSSLPEEVDRAVFILFNETDNQFFENVLGDEVGGAVTIYISVGPNCQLLDLLLKRLIVESNAATFSISNESSVLPTEDIVSLQKTLHAYCRIGD